ncbi:MAG: ATP-dependent DNA helicase RecG [Nakamurella sp.]
MPPSGATPALSTPLKLVLGGRTAAPLAKASLVTIADLLRYYPRKYSRRGELTDLAALRVGDTATVWARIASIDTRPLGRGGKYGKPRHLTKIVVTDGRRALECAFFNQPWLSRQLRPGVEAMLSGTVSDFRGTLQMSSPELATADGSVGDVDNALQVLETFAGGIIPSYRQTGGVTTTVLQRSVRHVLTVIGPIPDPVPSDLVSARKLVDLDTALRNVHRPASDELLESALDRLRYDEALAVQLVLARRRAAARARPSRPYPRVVGGLAATLDAALPFELTAGQRRVGEEIAVDLAGDYPMNRLLQGDVGSGKTVVALRAMIQVVDAGGQAVMLAPTEVLAAQHARTLRAILGPLGRGGELESVPNAITVTVLTGSATAPQRRAALLDIASGQPGIVVGTHALLSDDVIFTNLGLVVVDEQHRFGVEQRDTLRAKGSESAPAHLLVMTATPIPRTVAMTAYGDLDVSVLSELPAGRRAIATTVVPAAEKPAWMDRVWQRVREEVTAGHQAYVVCPKIGDESSDGHSGDDGDSDDDSDDDIDQHSDGDSNENEYDGAAGDDSSARRPPLAVLDVLKSLRDGPLAGLRLAALHGQMAPADKDSVMRDFAAGVLDVLVSTTVIEVGVDVANATAMVIMDADRFGISQLHQLRGRVGRSDLPGVCLLVSEARAGSTGRTRLDAVAATTDGFELAEADLDLRREGDVLGTSQAGRQTSLKLLSLRRDLTLLKQARDDAMSLVGEDPAISAHPGLAKMADAIVDPDGQDYLAKG